MLASIGEAPIASLDSATQADVVTALNILRNTTREVQAKGWRFNSEFGYQVKPFLTWNWLGEDNVTTELSAYRPPDKMIAFEMTQSPDQQGTKYTDAVVRPARTSFSGPSERQITRDPDYPGIRFGAEFQSGIGTGASTPITVTFDMPVQSVTVTCFDPTNDGNSMAAYDENDVLLGTAAFAGNHTPGVNTPSTQTLTFASIKKLILTPAAADYVAYSMTYVAAGTQAIDGNVFYDRARNRDGWPTSERTYLYINPIWLFDFEDMPETARNYCVVRASRRLAQRALGSAELASFNMADEVAALRDLKRDQGERDDYNVFNNAEMERGIGGRRPGVAGISDRRSSPGPKVN